MASKMTDGCELRFERLLNAPRTNVWRCWTEPALLAKWFAPQFWTTQVMALDLRPGGKSHIIMHGPNGEISDGVAVFLEAVPEERLAFTNAFAPGWTPSSVPAVVPFMVTIIEMSDESGGTRYLVRALHWTEAARKRHEEVGFHDGWAQTVGPLEAAAQALSQGP